MFTLAIGKAGEDYAAAYLEENGYNLLERNWRFERIELDIICQKDGYIVFTEVKARAPSVYGRPCLAVNAKKQERIIKAATAFWLYGNHKHLQPRFDVIEVYIERGTGNYKINHIRSAFITK